MEQTIQNMLQQALCGGIVVSILLGAIPAVRYLIGIYGIGISALGLSPFFVGANVSISYLAAIKTGIALSIPLLFSYELIACLSKSLEIFRGSQLAEQLFVQERGGPIEFGLFLLLTSIFLSDGGGELLLSQALLISTSGQIESSVDGSRSLQGIYQIVLSYVFPLAGLGVVLELLSGIFQRVSKKNFLGVEFSSLRAPVVIFWMVSLLEFV